MVVLVLKLACSSSVKSLTNENLISQNDKKCHRVPTEAGSAALGHLSVPTLQVPLRAA